MTRSATEAKDEIEHIARAIMERRVKPDFYAVTILADGSTQWVVDHDAELARAAKAAMEEWQAKESNSLRAEINNLREAINSIDAPATRPDLAVQAIRTIKALATKRPYASEIDALRAENDDLKTSVVAFLAPWAVRYAQDFGLDGLHPVHYDILEKCGARMDSFKRSDIPKSPYALTHPQ